MSASSLSPLASKFLIGVAVLGLLYLARDVLEPVTLAATLAFVLAPVVRRFRGLGLGQAPAAMAALTVAGLLMTGLAMVLVAQLGAMSRELPAYESNVREKIVVLRKFTVDQLREAQGRAGRMVGDLAPGGSVSPSAEMTADRAVGPQQESNPNATGRPGPTDDSVEVLRQLVATLWGPVGTVGIVVLVLIFALLEQDALRDRLIRLLGGTDVRAATSAVNDAGQRLSRYFVSQFSVNLGVAVVIGALLALLGVPHAAVWAVLAGLLRFIPYVGFPAAAVCACLMAAAMSPGWDLVWSTGLVFLGVELLVAHVIEPQLYGHATGLSPFSVVVSAIFWSALWGPVGLLLSTPLTLCLVVAGRHVPALAFLDILLGDAPALNLAQRFYQRGLSGDSVEILADARSFLRRKSLAVYCDRVVLPAFHMARQDFEQNLITPEQRQAAQSVILQVFGELGHLPRPRPGRASRGAVLDGDLGLRMRQDRVATEGRWQGRLDVPAGSLLMCISMDDAEAHLIAELLVRVLRSEQFDARHITVQELAEPPDGARAESVGSVFVVGARDDRVNSADAQLLNHVLSELPGVHRVSVLPGQRTLVDQISAELPHRTAYSFEEIIGLLHQKQG
ncbi:AI-2E family transporter [Roseateles amylovorans]|uniref:AI-2E family transporter n=1 Tax=Roseateles amylovorans TaxID=2978473 RepID=A0ABY6AUU6_9BURK|nr:AI-2E family transporter [Roseateles amylovorans]UXH76078.1 AI-2E family transporter [Roseateles amylovorans]